MSKPRLKRVLQIVGALLALVALAVIAYGLTDWSKRFTPDGVMTLIAGVLAFAAVQWQMWDQRRTLRQEQNRHNRAVATALLSEIDHIYDSYLPEARIYADKLRGRRLSPKAAVGTYSTAAAFDVYLGDMQSLGDLGPKASRLVIRFYKAAWDLQDNLRRYWECLAQGDPMELSDSLLAGVEESSRLLMIGVLDTCSELCSATGLRPDSIDAKVFKDRAEITNLAISVNAGSALPGQVGQ